MRLCVSVAKKTVHLQGVYIIGTAVIFVYHFNVGFLCADLVR